MTGPLRVLCLDIEGGFGGSSRSLYFLLRHLDRARVEPVVWCRRDGPIRARYDEIGIPVTIMPEMPKASALPRATRNLAQLAGHAMDYVRGHDGLERLATAAASFDVVHFNHEGLATLARWLKRRAHRPQTMHIRTNVRPSVFARAQMLLISRAVQSVAFITANEERTFRSLGGTAPGRVIFNVVEPAAKAERHPAVPCDGRLVVASLSNAAWIRGTDRLLEVAQELAALGRRDVLFVIAGDIRLAGSWPGALSKVAARGGTLADAAAGCGLSDMFLFLGHVAEPERVLAASDVLIKPTREDNPWGRDILEALAAGVPVISVGSDATFVETRATGILQPIFDAHELASIIAGLAVDRRQLAEMGRAAQERVARLCDGPSRAQDLSELWHAAAGRAQ